MRNDQSFTHLFFGLSKLCLWAECKITKAIFSIQKLCWDCGGWNWRSKQNWCLPGRSVITSGKTQWKGKMIPPEEDEWRSYLAVLKFYWAALLWRWCELRRTCMDSGEGSIHSCLMTCHRSLYDLHGLLIQDCICFFKLNYTSAGQAIATFYNS